MKQKNILIVDDSEFDRNLISSALKRKGNINPIEACDGEECLEKLKSEKIDLVLMDIMMPGKWGSQVLIKIREQFNAIELPIIMVTSKTDSSDIISCLQHGANDYITKPINIDVAMSRIATHLRLSEVSHEMSKLKEMAALDAMIITYNHEINNPLAIAIGRMHYHNDEILSSALWRVADVVKKIKEVTSKKEVEYCDYIGSSKMVKIKSR